jgi:ribosomal protein S18 acetylase RimI-like enzyme
MIESVREATKDDFKAVQEIQKESFNYTYSDSKLEEYLKELFFVAEVDGKVVSYTIAKRDGHLIHFATDKKFRHKGIGRRLLYKVEYELKKLGVRRAHLHVRENNPYQKFHEDMGYTAKSSIPNYYKNGETAVFMEKELF